MNHTQKISLERRTHLPDADYGIGNKNQEDDDGFHEGGGWFLSFLKQSQHLHDKGDVNSSNTANMDAKHGEWSCNCHTTCLQLNWRLQTIKDGNLACHRWAVLRSYFMILLAHFPGTAGVLHFQSAAFVKAHLSREGCKPLIGWAGDKVDQGRFKQRLAL